MTTVDQGRTEWVHLAARDAITIVAAAGSAGSVHHKDLDEANTAIAADETVVVGPYGAPTKHAIICAAGSLSYTIAPVDFQAPSEAAKGAIASYLATAAGTATLLAAAPVDQMVQIVIHVTTVFANGTGAQPTLQVGETGVTGKFAAAAVFTNAAAGSKIVLTGTLAANKALILTQTAAAGDGTGAYTAAVIAAPVA